MARRTDPRPSRARVEPIHLLSEAPGQSRWHAAQSGAWIGDGLERDDSNSFKTVGSSDT